MVTVFGALLRHRLVALVLTAAGVLAGLGFAAVQRPQPSASALVVVRDPRGAGAADGSVAARYTADQAALLRSHATALAAGRLLQEKDPAAMAKVVERSLAVDADTASNSISLRFEARTRGAAARGLNAVIMAYEASVADAFHAQTDAAISAIDGSIAALTASATVAPSAADQAQARLAISPLLTQRATLVTQRSDPAPGVANLSSPVASTPHLASAAIRGLGVGLVVGLLAAALLCYLLETRRPLLLQPDDVVQHLGLRPLAVLPASSSWAAYEEQAPELALAAAGLRRQAHDWGIHSVALLAVGRDGRAGTIARAIAGACTTVGSAALVVDLTEPSGAGHAERPGLAEVAAGALSLGAATREVAVGAGVVVPVLGVGVRRWGSLLWPDAVEEELVADGYDLALLAMASPTEPHAPIGVLAGADAALVAIVRGTPARPVAELVERLADLGVPLVGCVLTTSPRRGRASRARAEKAWLRRSVAHLGETV